MRKLKLSPEAQLCLDHPDFAQLVYDEYWEWVMYGMFLGHFCKDLLTDKFTAFKDFEAEMAWLDTQCDDGRDLARNHAIAVFDPNYPKRNPHLFL